MKVLFVHSRMPGGGLERVTLTLVEEFQKRGITCCLALRRSCGELVDEARALADVVELAPSGMYQFVPSLTDLIKDFAPTHIITAAPDVTILTLIALKRAASGARIVQGMHVAQTRAAYKKGVGGSIRRLYERLLARLAYNRIDGVVAGLEEFRRNCTRNLVLQRNE